MENDDPLQFLKRASESDPPVSLSVTELLRLWGEERRSADVVERIRTDLAQFGLTTDPPFTRVWPENTVTLRRRRPNEGSEPEDYDSEGALRFAHLTSASRRVHTVRESDSLVKAWTEMVDREHSQLAVVGKDGDYRGVVTERSIAAALFKPAKPTTVAEVTVRDQRPVMGDNRVLDLLDEVYAAGFAAIVDDAQRPIGIVTVGDLLREFVMRHSPILTIGVIELRVRKRVAERIDRKVLDRHLPKRSKGDPDAALTLGKYAHMLRPLEHWERLGWVIDHDYFLRMIGKTARIRNEITHFSPDPPSAESLADIEAFARTLHELT
ncbi:CBS domain-containing protein [Salininema proteolyticum]|uniref:HPP family protein n=1 Tax=Salininema proteolyticum TaxID=1607685 RepID=A0ABV8TZH6_9ACTN